MATDRKADYVSDHGGKYLDIDGMTRQFTHIDHDKKPKVHFTNNENLTTMADYRKELITRLLELPASICPEIFSDFKTRDGNSISWNLQMVSDEGLPISQLRDLCVMCENKFNRTG